MSISRRDFFMRAARGAVDDLVGVVGRKEAQPTKSSETWVVLGGIRDYPTGTRREFRELGLTVDSSPLGLRVWDREGQVKPSRFDRFGQIWVDIAGRLPAEARLSWSTGEMVTE